MSLWETGIVLREQTSDKWHVKEPIPIEKYFLLLSAVVFNTFVEFSHQSLFCEWKKLYLWHE